jgi:hypothetical protein
MKNGQKFKPNSVQTFNQNRRSRSKDFLNSDFWFWSNFISFCFVHEKTFLLGTNIAVAYSEMSENY